MPNRLQREIEELLAQLEETLPPRRRPRVRDAAIAPFNSVRRWLRNLRPPHISLGHLLLLGIAVTVIAYVLGDSIDNPSLVRILILGGIALFIAAFVLSLRRQSRPPAKRWRGQPMNLGSPKVGSHGRSWWGRWRHRR